MHKNINPKTHSGDRAITQSYKVEQTHTGNDCKYIQASFLNLSIGDKQNDFVIVNTKNNKEKYNHVRADS